MKVAIATFLFLVSSLSVANDCEWNQENNWEKVICPQIQVTKQEQNLWQKWDVEFHDGFSLSLETGQTTKGDFGKKISWHLGKRTRAALNENDQENLELVEEFVSSTLSPSSWQGFDFFASLPVDQPLSVLKKMNQDILKPSRHSLRGPREDVFSRSYTSICKDIGKRKYGAYTIENNTFFKLVPIGFTASKCYGRCGWGCSWIFGSKQRYTQQCLDHDLCHRETGENLGICAHHFWSASDGFFNAPEC